MAWLRDPDRFITAWDDAMDANLAAVIATQDAVILGHRSYDEWAAFWPDSEIEPFATFINGVTKHVATSTALDREWANATVYRRRPGRVRTGPEGAARRRRRRPCQHHGCPGAAVRRPRRRDRAGDRTDDRGQRTKALDGSTSARLEQLRSQTSPSGHLLVDSASSGEHRDASCGVPPPTLPKRGLSDGRRTAPAGPQHHRVGVALALVCGAAAAF